MKLKGRLDMQIDGIEVQQHQLSYDKIIKNTLSQSDELTIRFINGLFGDRIPLNAEVEWLDKETLRDSSKAYVADFYPRINGKLYSIEIEQDDSGDMALRVLRYALGGALHHNTSATASEVNVEFPQPCVIYLKSRAETPRSLKWNISFFDGQKVTLKIPAIHLTDLSLKEIAQRDLFPIGQFYLRTIEPLTDSKIPDFRAAAETMLYSLRESVECEIIPYHIGLEMQNTIRKTAENTIYRFKKEVNLTMDTNILETLPWIDYQELYRKLEERGRAEGQMEMSVNAFVKMGSTKTPKAIAQMLSDFGIPKDVIDSAKTEADRTHPGRLRRDDRDAR
jgi:hypothetical protein